MWTCVDPCGGGALPRLPRSGWAALVQLRLEVWLFFAQERGRYEEAIATFQAKVDKAAWDRQLKNLWCRDFNIRLRRMLRIQCFGSCWGLRFSCLLAAFLGFHLPEPGPAPAGAC